MILGNERLHWKGSNYPPLVLCHLKIALDMGKNTHCPIEFIADINNK